MPTPRLDAEVLLAHVLQLERLDMLLDVLLSVETEDTRRFQQCIDDRLAGKPVAYIIGAAEFWSLPFKVTSDVLIPRPDSEILVDAVLPHIPQQTPFTFVDLGTGSGCLAISILLERPLARAIAVDVSPAALSIARENGERLGVGERLELIQADMLTWLEQGDVPLDLILSNPPYITSADIADLSPSVRSYEPLSALDGGRDGLDFYRGIADYGAPRLGEGGIMALEIGHDQGPALREILEPAFGTVELYQDLGQRDRAVIARRKPTIP